MSDIHEIAKSLRLVGLTEVDDAAALLEAQAEQIADARRTAEYWKAEHNAANARIAELEARAGEAVAWQVRRADGRIDSVPIQWEPCTKELYDATLATGRYAGYENGPRCEVRALCVFLPTGDAAGKDSVDAARWSSLLATLIREIDDREYDRPYVGTENAPGHAHDVPGIWDPDNGRLAGKQCAWCATWNAARAAIASLTKTADGEIKS